MIEITVTKADAAAANLETLTSGMVNAIFLRFTFSEEWSALSKVAVFTNGSTTIDLLEAEWLSNDTCAVPPEILSIPGKTVKVGLRGYSEDGKTVLPTTMCSLGSVKPGPSASVDKAPPQTPAVWEQLQAQIVQLRNQKMPCYTTLEKLNANAASQSSIRIFLHGIELAEGPFELHVYQCMRRRKRTTYWRHPSNWNAEPGKGVCKVGYGQIASYSYAHGKADTEEVLFYPEVPEWMPNNGYLKTVLPLTTSMLKRGFLDLDLTKWLLPMLKPTEEVMDWSRCGLIGIQKNGTDAPILFQFRLASNGKVVGEAKDTLAVGMRGSFSPDTGFLTPDMTLKNAALYVSIR